MKGFPYDSDVIMYVDHDSRMEIYVLAGWWPLGQSLGLTFRDLDRFKKWRPGQGWRKKKIHGWKRYAKRYTREYARRNGLSIQPEYEVIEHSHTH